MGPRSTIRCFGRVRRLIPLAATLLLATLVAIPSSAVALTQGKGIVLVNADREFVDRKNEGKFVTRPVFYRKIETFFYAIRDADTGEWISVMYRVIGREKHRSDGWEYSWGYPALKEQPELDPDHSYLLAMLANAGGETTAFDAVIPVYEPSRIWDRILSALNPARWARAFAGWVIEGVHGTLCGAVERASGADADNCGGGKQSWKS